MKPGDEADLHEPEVVIFLLQFGKGHKLVYSHRNSFCNMFIHTCVCLLPLFYTDIYWNLLFKTHTHARTRTPTQAHIQAQNNGYLLKCILSFPLRPYTFAYTMLDISKGRNRGIKWVVTRSAAIDFSLPLQWSPSTFCLCRTYELLDCLRRCGILLMDGQEFALQLITMSIVFLLSFF